MPRDARAHVPAALERGAVACLVEHAGAEAFGFSDDRLASLAGLKAATGHIAAQWFGQPPGAAGLAVGAGEGDHLQRLRRLVKPLRGNVAGGGFQILQRSGRRARQVKGLHANLFDQTRGSTACGGAGNMGTTIGGGAGPSDKTVAGHD